MKDVKVNVVNAYELKEGKKYIIVFDHKSITMEDAHNLLKTLKELDIQGIGVALEDISSMKIVETN